MRSEIKDEGRQSLFDLMNDKNHKQRLMKHNVCKKTSQLLGQLLEESGTPALEARVADLQQVKQVANSPPGHPKSAKRSNSAASGSPSEKKKGSTSQKSGSTGSTPSHVSAPEGALLKCEVIIHVLKYALNAVFWCYR